jgi:CheY-like chemotaxis protein
MKRRALIHIAEDLDIDSIAFQRAINKSDYADRLEIRRFRNGTEVLDHYGQGDMPDILFLDVNLGDYSGFEVLERLRAIPDFIHFPTIVYSSSQDPKDIRRCYELGANGYLVKPLGARRLRPLLESCFRYWLDSVRIPSSEEFQSFGKSR